MSNINIIITTAWHNIKPLYICKTTFFLSFTLFHNSWYIFFLKIFVHYSGEDPGSLWHRDGLFKGYLCWKIITSQNVSSETQVKNCFILQKNYVPFSRYSSFFIFNHPMIYQICDVMMSISTQDKVHFWVYFLNHNSLSQQT